MIQAIDNYLPEEIFSELKEFSNNEFQDYDLGHKVIKILPTPEKYYPYFEVDGFKIITSFLRFADEETDTDHNIHADNIILDKKADGASILYIDVKETGTAFWQHKTHGRRLSDVSDYNRILKEDSQTLDNWEMKDFISGHPNRYLLYDANMFHSKYPNKSTSKRIVLVNFYEVPANK